jgi:hypothetical protein
MRQSKRCFEKYDVEVLSLEGTYLRTEARRAVIRDGDETCSVEEYACRHFLDGDTGGRRSGWPDLFIFRDNEFFFAEVKSATDTLGKSQQRWLRDNRERLHFPFKLVDVRKMELEVLAGA